VAVLALQAAFAGLLDRAPARDATVVVNNIVELAVVAACFRTARRFRGAERRWRLLIGAWAVGSALATVLTAAALFTAGAQATRASPAYFLVLVPCFAALAGLLSLPTDPPYGPAEGRTTAARSSYRWHVVTVLDGLLIVGSIVLLAWGTVLARLVPARGLDRMAFVLTLSYTVTNMILVITVALIVSFRRPRSPAILGLLGGGLVVNAIVGVALIYGSLLHHTVFLPWHIAAFSTAFVLILLSALVPVRASPRVGDERPPGRRATWAHALLPYAVLVAAGLLVLSRLTTGSRTDRVETYGIVALLVVALVRQMVTLAENTRLLTEIRDREQEVRHQAYHDPLTGLANRTLFNRRLERALTRDPVGVASPASGTPISVLFIDLDHFKQVNDVYGHAAGDELLRISAQRLRADTRATDTVARLGGDEFAVILEGRDPGTVRDIGERLAAGIQVPCVLAGRRYTPRASVGLVTATLRDPDQPVSPEVLLHEADLAMYAAKRLRAGTLVVYQPDQDRAERDLPDTPRPHHRQAHGRFIGPALDAAGRLLAHPQPRGQHRQHLGG
jgi:diguanylate cyclase (GGDEF)-like protein